MTQRWALCLEQTLGHRAHGLMLETAASCAPAAIDIFRIEFATSPRVRMPWAVRGSFNSLRQIRGSASAYDVAFFHTQSVSLFAPLARKARSFVVSVDATPMQMDELGAGYGHRRGGSFVEGMKSRWYREVFRRADAVVAWSEWAADSLVGEYGVPAGRILVCHPGAPPELLALPIERDAERRPRILFVGGDFERKGGYELLEAFATLGDSAELTLVTESNIEGLPPGVTVLKGVKPGSEALFQAYADSDIFCMPTRSDCTPIVIAEAMAAGLPVVTTDVGSNAEFVRSGENGILIEPGDAVALGRALGQLVQDRTERACLARRGREYAIGSLDARRNAARIFRLLEGVTP